nr:MAG TPA: hypothetical protein [Bacteriophage sp.]
MPKFPIYGSFAPLKLYAIQDLLFLEGCSYLIQIPLFQHL